MNAFFSKDYNLAGIEIMLRLPQPPGVRMIGLYHHTCLLENSFWRNKNLYFFGMPLFPLVELQMW